MSIMGMEPPLASVAVSPCGVSDSVAVQSVVRERSVTFRDVVAVDESVS